MANMEITNNDVGGVVLMDGDFKDELLTFAGDDTFLEGTILARLAVDLAVVATADGSNTGAGTITDVTVAAGAEVPIVGDWILTFTRLITAGGAFELKDPNGMIVAFHEFITTPETLEIGGFQMTLTDGNPDWSVDDFFTLVVVANGKMVPFNPAGAGGAQIAKSVLTYDVSKVGAGDVPIRNMISGSLRKERLIIDVDGDDSNITDAILDELRNYTLVGVNVQELNILDNQ